MITGINPLQMKSQLDFLSQFFTKSTIFEWGNYVELRASNNVLTLALPLIIEDNIANGLMEVHVDYEEGEFEEVVITVANLTKLKNLLKGDTMEVEVFGDNRVEFRIGKIKHMVSTVAQEIPRLFKDTLKEMSEEPLHTFPLEDIKDILKVMGKEIGEDVINYSYRGIYVTPQETFVNTGMKFVNYEKIVDGLETSFYLPTYMTKVFNKIDGEVEFSQKQYDPTQSPYVYVQGEGFRFTFKEWISKDVYPIEQMQEIMNKQYLSLPPELVRDAIAPLTRLSDMIRISFLNGVVSTMGGSSTTEIETVILNIEDKLFSQKVLPMMKILQNTSECGLVGEDMLYIYSEEKKYYIMRAVEAL